MTDKDNVRPQQPQQAQQQLHRAQQQQQHRVPQPQSAQDGGGSSGSADGKNKDIGNQRPSTPPSPTPIVPQVLQQHHLQQQQRQQYHRQAQQQQQRHHQQQQPSPSMISVTVAPFTGGPFQLSVRRTDSVEDLKKAVAKRLKVLKDRICLLYRER